MAIPILPFSYFTGILGQTLNEPVRNKFTRPGESGTEYPDQSPGKAAHDVQMNDVGELMRNDRLQPLMGPPQGNIHMGEPNDNPLIGRIGKSIGIVISIQNYDMSLCRWLVA